MEVVFEGVELSEEEVRNTTLIMRNSLKSRTRGKYQLEQVL